ncbi:hypothetical protein BSKO_08161 [Bryopsis sp. KO-2023]|nr:hypothetical protein BSKO_08161 [Bryopsis sp. KO-2023]
MEFSDCGFVVPVDVEFASSSRKLAGEDTVGKSSVFRPLRIKASPPPQENSNRLELADEDEELTGNVRTIRVGECTQCDDVAPKSSRFTCEEHVERGNCSKFFLRNHCNCSCARCPTDDSVEKAVKETEPTLIEIDIEDEEDEDEEEADTDGSTLIKSKTATAGDTSASIGITTTVGSKKPKSSKVTAKKKSKSTSKSTSTELELEEEEERAAKVTGGAVSASVVSESKKVKSRKSSSAGLESTKSSKSKPSAEDKDEDDKIEARRKAPKKVEEVDAEEEILEEEEEDEEEEEEDEVLVVEEEEKPKKQCKDIPPPWSYYSCEDQAKLHKCETSWMRGYCLSACKKCESTDGGEVGDHDDPTFRKCPSTCNNKPPKNSKQNCESQKTLGKCDRDWMEGSCECTCGKCSAMAKQFEKELQERAEKREKMAELENDPCKGIKGKSKKLKCKRKAKSKKKPTVRAKDVPEGNVRFTIIHFNDFHSRIEPADMYHGMCSKEENEAGTCHGGVARMKVVIEQERAAAKARGEEVLLLDAGDDFVGTLWDHHYKGEAISKFFNRLDIDAMTLGNHEFDYGPDVVANHVKSVNYPVISSNLKANGHWLGDLVHDKIIKEINGTKVGICGTTTQVTMSWSHPWPVQFEDSTIKARECVENLKAEGVEIVIFLSHEGDHIWDGYPAWVDSWVEESRRIPVAQAAWASRYIGRLTVEFDSKGELVHIEGTPILLGGDASNNVVKEDPEWKAEVEE